VMAGGGSAVAGHQDSIREAKAEDGGRLRLRGGNGRVNPRRVLLTARE
jgi:hypothetical protein